MINRRQKGFFCVIIFGMIVIHICRCKRKREVVFFFEYEGKPAFGWLSVRKFFSLYRYAKMLDGKFVKDVVNSYAWKRKRKDLMEYGFIVLERENKSGKGRKPRRIVMNKVKVPEELKKLWDEIKIELDIG